MISPDDIVSLLPDFLPRQRWYGAAISNSDTVEVIAFDVLRAEWPMLGVDARRRTFADDSTAPVPGARRAAPLEQTERFLEGKGRSFLGDVDTDDGPGARVRRARRSRARARAPAPHRAGRGRRTGASAQRRAVEHVGRLRRALIMKLFRRVADGPEPRRRDDRGARRRRASSTSARRWPRGGATAATSPSCASSSTGAPTAGTRAHVVARRLRQPRGPAEAGGDFAPEARRLGRITAEMHLALAEAFGDEHGEPDAWADDDGENLSRSRARALDAEAIARGVRASCAT